MAIDYEKEYDNRARVPEHPQIFARWQREAAAYRETARDAELGLAYGPSPRQTIDLFPAKDDDDSTPLVLFIHGGWWRSLEPAMFSQMAAGLNARGVSVAVAGYDFCPQVSIADIIAEMRSACLWLWRRKRRRLSIVGHSAGGHLAACMLAQDWPALASDAPTALVASAYGISGVYDLAPVLKISVNQDLKLDEAEARRVSPVHWRPPRGLSFDAVVGEKESDEFLRQSRDITEAWHGPVRTRYEIVAGADHFTIVDALADPTNAMCARVSDLAFAANAIS